MLAALEIYDLPYSIKAFTRFPPFNFCPCFLKSCSLFIFANEGFFCSRVVSSDPKRHAISPMIFSRDYPFPSLDDCRTTPQHECTKSTAHIHARGFAAASAFNCHRRYRDRRNSRGGWTTGRRVIHKSSPVTPKSRSLQLLFPCELPEAPTPRAEKPAPRNAAAQTTPAREDGEGETSGGGAPRGFLLVREDPKPDKSCPAVQRSHTSSARSGRESERRGVNDGNGGHIPARSFLGYR
jgi:hypothetical protein